MVKLQIKAKTNNEKTECQIDNAYIALAVLPLEVWVWVHSITMWFGQWQNLFLYIGISWLRQLTYTTLGWTLSYHEEKKKHNWVSEVFIGVVLPFQTQHQGERNSLLTRAAQKDSQSKKGALCFDHQTEESASIVLWTVTLWEEVLAKKHKMGKNCLYLFALKILKLLMQESLYSSTAISTANVEKCKTPSDIVGLQNCQKLERNGVYIQIWLVFFGERLLHWFCFVWEQMQPSMRRVWVCKSITSSGSVSL